MSMKNAMHYIESLFKTAYQQDARKASEDLRLLLIELFYDNPNELANIRESKYDYVQGLDTEVGVGLFCDNSDEQELYDTICEALTTIRFRKEKTGL